MSESTLKNKLKIYRAINDLTQEQLADLASVTRKTINTVEKGKFVPSTFLALKLAKILKTTVDELFYIEE
jgi:putative transcriptional regulator